MLDVISVLLIGIALSMDTFSLSVSLGMFMEKNKILFFSLLVGFMHFFMPLIGSILGSKITDIVSINNNLLLGIILLLIAIQMTVELFKKDEKIPKLSLLSLIILSLTVSLDSFTVGIGINALALSKIWCMLIFFICSFAFTYVGLLLGFYSKKALGKYGNVIGIIILSALGLVYLFM